MSHVVLKKNADGTSGLLNVFENHDGNSERHAQMAAQGWRSYMPTEHIWVKEVKYLSRCDGVCNKDGFPDRRAD